MTLGATGAAGWRPSGTSPPVRAREAGPRGALLILDEIHKVPAWSEIVERLWDEDSASGLALRLLVLGSSALAVRHCESLAGR